MSPRTRLPLLLALLAALGAFVAWDATQEDPGLAGVAEALPRTPHEPRAPGAADGVAAADTLPAGPRGPAAATPAAALDLFRPRRAAAADAPPPGENDNPDEARVVGTAQLPGPLPGPAQGHWVALVEHAGQTHWLAPGQRVGGLRVDRVGSRGVQVTDLARGTSQHLDLSPAGHIAGLHARPHDD